MAVLRYAAGETDAALAEIDRALSRDPARSDARTVKLAEFRKEQPGQGLPRPAPTDEGGVVCRACKSPFVPDAESPGTPGLCPACREALALDNWVPVSAGSAVLPEGTPVHVPGFTIDKCPVTNRVFSIYLRVMKVAGPGKEGDWPKNHAHSLFRHPDQPMTCVSRADCEAFCACARA